MEQNENKIKRQVEVMRELKKLGDDFYLSNFKSYLRLRWYEFSSRYMTF